MIQAKLDDLFETGKLVVIVELMRSCVQLKDAMKEAKDAAIRGTDGMEKDKVASREAIMRLANQVLFIRFMDYLNSVSGHLADVDDERGNT